MELVPTGRANATNVGVHVLIPPPQSRDKCFLFVCTTYTLRRAGALSPRDQSGRRPLRGATVLV